jgi:hypothetical protein
MPVNRGRIEKAFEMLRDGKKAMWSHRPFLAAAHARRLDRGRGGASASREPAMSLDFKRATDLFMGTEKELSAALGLQVGDLRAFRQNPDRVSAATLRRLARVLVERGNGMRRVGELLLEDSPDA